MSPDDPITAATTHYEDLQQRASDARNALFDACADRVRAGLDTADTLATRTPFTAVTIRKELRARGVDALPRGPRARKA